MKAACKNHGLTPDNTFEQIGQLWNSIQQVAKDSFLDHRFILSMVLQGKFYQTSPTKESVFY